MRKSIEIDGNKYPIRFGYGALRILADKWDCKGVQSVGNAFQEIFPTDKKDTDISFEQGDKIGDLALAGMENAGVTDLPDRDTVVEGLIFNQDQLEILINAFADSFPKQGNPQPVKKTGKKKK